MTNKIIFSLLAFFSLLSVTAQEVLRPLGASSVLIEAWKQKKQHAQTQKMQSAAAQFLPFYDDFSYDGPYPDPSRWDSSTSVFVNHTKATLPITIGVATFDGLKANGYPYNPAATSGSIPCDTLLSIPLRLDSSSNGVPIIPTDSVCLRFYYQARGVWEKPESSDDISLDFYSPTSGWHPAVWSHSGYDPLSDNTFHRVMIVIDDTTYLKNGFRFRFRNNSTGCGDVDHWHIDGIFIDKNLRPSRDTIINEFAFTHDAPSLLKNYSQMPFEQFTGAADMRSNIDVTNNLRNNYTSGATITTFGKIFNNAGALVKDTTYGTNNVYPYKDSGYCHDPALIYPPLNNFTYGSGPFADSTSFLLKFFTAYFSDNFPGNDAIYYRQKFHNYFAYDDGSAEAGYGFQSPGGYTAARYVLNKPDTLRAVDIFFDPIIYANQIANGTIHVRVWDDNGSSMPGAIRADSAFWTFPVYSQNGFDVFQRYQLVTPVTYTAATTFYVGVWQQLGNFSLNIGYDLNNDSHNNVLYNIGSGWNASSFKGSIMIRPVFGDSSRAVGIKNTDKQKENVALYPNPASNEIFVNAESGAMKVSVCDLLGNTLLEENGGHVITSSLPNGLYLVKTITRRGYCDVQKLLIAR